MIDLRKALGAKAMTAGLIGLLAAGGVGVAAAATGDSQPVDVPAVGSPLTRLPSTVSDLIPDLDASDATDPADITDITDLPEAEVPEAPEAPEIGDHDDSGDVDDSDGGDVGDPDGGDVNATRPDNFGATVSADARGESDGVPGVDGRQISAAAKAKHSAGGTDDGDDDGTEDGTDDGADGGGAGQTSQGQGAGHGRR